MTDRRPYHHGDLRLALIEAAEGILRDAGAWSFTLREVARAAGVSHNAPYNHFSDRTALLAAVAARAFDRLGAALDREIAGSGPDLDARIEAAAVAYVGFGVAEPAAFRLMFSADLAGCEDPAFRTAMARAFAGISDLMAEGARTEVLKIDPAGINAATAWALVHGLTHLILDGRLTVVALDPPTLARSAARTLLDGLRPGAT